MSGTRSLVEAAAILPASGRDTARRRSPLRRGVAVALLGPDGAGKTTLARLLASDPDLHACRIYMGRNAAARTLGLPMPAWVQRYRPGTRSAGSSLLSGVRKSLSFMHVLADQWFRYAIAHWYRWRGGVVVFDRYIHDPDLRAEKPGRGIRLRTWLLHIGAPTPDVIVVLDAEPDVLYARKQDQTPQRLRQLRAAYARVAAELPGAAVVDATQDEQAVKLEVLALIRARMTARGRA